MDGPTADRASTVKAPGREGKIDTVRALQSGRPIDSEAEWMHVDGPVSGRRHEESSRPLVYLEPQAARFQGLVRSFFLLSPDAEIEVRMRSGLLSDERIYPPSAPDPPVDTAASRASRIASTLSALVNPCESGVSEGSN